MGVNTMINAMGQNLGFAVPVSSFRYVLGAFSKLSTKAIRTVDPVYRCIGCDGEFIPGRDRCTRCGTAVPYSGSASLAHSVAMARAERIVTQLLKQVGLTTSQAWSESGLWRVSCAWGELWLRAVDDCTLLEVSARIGSVPRTGHEGLYRFLLTFNDSNNGVARTAIRDDVILLSLQEPLAFINLASVATSVRVLTEQAEQLHSFLRNAFRTPSAPNVLEESQ